MFTIILINETLNTSRNIPINKFIDAINFINDVPLYGSLRVLEKTKTYFKIIDWSNNVITAKIT